MTDGGDYNIPFAFLKKRGDKYFCPLVPKKRHHFSKGFVFQKCVILTKKMLVLVYGNNV